jgi:hypothetical protein
MVVQTLGFLDDAPGLGWAARLAGRGELDVLRLRQSVRRAAPGGPRVLPGLPRAELWTEVRPLGFEPLDRQRRSGCRTGQSGQPVASESRPAAASSARGGADTRRRQGRPQAGAVARTLDGAAGNELATPVPNSADTAPAPEVQACPAAPGCWSSTCPAMLAGPARPGASPAAAQVSARVRGPRWPLDGLPGTGPPTRPGAVDRPPGAVDRPEAVRGLSDTPL